MASGTAAAPSDSRKKKSRGRRLGALHGRLKATHNHVLTSSLGAYFFTTTHHGQLQRMPHGLACSMGGRGDEARLEGSGMVDRVELRRQELR